MTWVPTLAKKIPSKRHQARKHTLRNDAGPKEDSPELETRTELSHQIPSQEPRAAENRGDLSRDRAPAGRAVLDSWLFAGVFASHDVMVASL